MGILKEMETEGGWMRPFHRHRSGFIAVQHENGNCDGSDPLIKLSACSTWQDTCLSLKSREGYQAHGE